MRSSQDGRKTKLGPAHASATALQHRAITTGDAADLEKLVGKWMRRDLQWRAIADPVSEQDIRRYATYSVGDDNPLWCDVQYGRESSWGSVTGSPTFLYSIDSTVVAPGLPGVQWIMGGSRWTTYAPVRPGDVITAQARLVSIKERPAKHVQRLIIQTGETVFVNQRGTWIAAVETDILRVPRTRSGKGLHDLQGSQSTQPHYDPEAIEELREAYTNEYRRGSEVRYWEDVNRGARIPRIPKGPLTMVDIVAFYVGRRRTYSPLKLAFLERERHPGNVYISPETGIPVHPAAGHFDPEIAREIGMPRPYDVGYMRIGWLGHLLTNWAGDCSSIRKLNVRLRRPHLQGSLLWCTGTVRDKRVEDGRHVVTINCEGVDQDGQVVMTGTACVHLPSRTLKDFGPILSVDRAHVSGNSGSHPEYS